MLNTDAHNPMMDTHMTRDDFIMMVRLRDKSALAGGRGCLTKCLHVMFSELITTREMRPRYGAATGYVRRRQLV